MYIGGEWVDALEGETLETKNPYTGETWATLPRARAVDADRAVAAAKASFNSPEWSKMTPSARGHSLRRLGDLIAENVEHLAATEVADNGKLLAEMCGQVGAVFIAGYHTRRQAGHDSPARP